MWSKYEVTKWLRRQQRHGRDEAPASSALTLLVLLGAVILFFILVRG